MQSKSRTPNSKSIFLNALFKIKTVKRALMVSIVVGTILVAVNQGDLLISGKIPPLWKIILTYLVPYSVSSYSTAASLLDMRNNK